MKKDQSIFQNRTMGVGLIMFAAFFLSSIPLGWTSNVVGNPNFEQEIGSGTGENWDSTNGAVRANAADLAGLGNPIAPPPEGDFALRIPDGSFTFQVDDTIRAGDFVTFSALGQSSAAAGTGGRLKIEFKSINSDGSDTLIDNTSVSSLINNDTAPAGLGNSYVLFNAQGIAPAGTNRVVFVLETVGGGGENTAFDLVQGVVNPANFSAVASKTSVQSGEPVVMHVQFRNPGQDVVENVEIVSSLPSGFNVDFDSARINGQKATVREGSVVITVGNLNPGQTVDVGFIVFAGSGTAPGKSYDFFLHARNNLGALTRVQRILLQVKADPLFDEGTIIGKVFNDMNQNGMQDDGEKGIPSVRLATEEGIVVVTDMDGKYHIPGIKPGRHLVKIDGHTLPQGTIFITEETYLIRTTPGIMSKANFAVLLPPDAIPEEFAEDLSVMVTQGIDLSRPKLDVEMEPRILRVGLGVLEENPVFRFSTNYSEYIKRWYLEVRDPFGQEIWTGFGVGKLPAEVVWEGITENGLVIKPGLYSYQLKVEDEKGRQDWTVLHFFRVLSKTDRESKATTLVEIPPVGDFNIFQDGKQSIPLVAKPTVRVQGKTKPGNKITVNSYPAEVDLNTGYFQSEFYTMPGEQQVVVTATTPEGESTSYQKAMEVEDSMFFMVGLGEQEFGVNMAKGNLDTVGQDDRFKDGFYEDGRLSYYLKGKLKGKFLIESHYDTEEKRSALFTNLDPEAYYPVYGDASSRDYSAQDTRDRFYFLIEMDRSFIKWGSYETEFNDTELATYNRTLSGLKAHYESLDSTPYGDPVKSVKMFWSEATHRPDHNEFAATGGSLYYLRNRNLIEGSEKIRVEIRDKISDTALHGYDMMEGKDYEIDYQEGRILLSRPLSSVTATDTLYTQDLLDGNQVYLVVDYEFDAGFDVSENSNRGIRGYTHFGDHIKIGATGVEDKRPEGDYDLRAVDATFKIGRNTKIVAEYAETKLEGVNHAISYNGGLSFNNIEPIRGPGARERENAFLIKAESKPTEKLELNGYVQAVEPGFSTDRLSSQEGTKKYGVSSLYRFNEYSFFRYRFDHTEVSDSLLPIQDHGVFAPFETIESHIVQAAYDDGLWLAQAEYRHQVTDLPEANLIPTLLSEVPFEDGLAVKLGYHVNERLLPYVKAQTNINGKANHQFGGGVRYEVARDLFAYLEQMVGNLGDSTYFGFEKNMEGGARHYANLRMFDRGIGSKTLTTAMGSSAPLGSKSRIYSEREHSTYNSEEGYADILGINGHMNERWDYAVKFERRHLDNATTRLLDTAAAASLRRSNTINTVTAALAYADGNKFRVRTAWDFRRDSDIVKLWQIAARNSLEYQLTPDLSFQSYLNYGISRFQNPEDTPASFMEFNTGLSYRPLNHDKLNVLARYTYVRDLANDIQFQLGYFPGSAEIDETAHILSMDIAYDLHRYLGLVEKLAYKRAMVDSSVTDSTALNSFLWAHRFNFHVTRKWDLALEYRVLLQGDIAESLQHGALIEVDREFYEYVRLGVGYDFTDFSDDLRKSNSYSSHGPFVRLTGKF